MIPVSFTAGFLVDYVTFQRIDVLFAHAVLIWDLFAAGAIIVILNAYDAGRIKWPFADKVVPFSPLFLQFAFGGLFSAFLLFYSKSGAWQVSWPFLFILAILFFGNEFFKKRYQRFVFRINIYFIALLFYLVFLLPVLFGSMGAVMFLASGALAVIILGGLLLAVRYAIPGRIAQSKKALIVSLGAVYALINIFYFTNIIPPIPLALKEDGVYHSIVKTNQNTYLYQVTFEPAPWYMPFDDISSTFHWQKGDIVYMYSAVFAPTKITTSIFHRWMLYDEAKKDWVQQSRIELSIAGGRDGGWRGYTFTRNIRPGKWRIDVITGRGQVLGRRTFTVVEQSSPYQLETGLR